MPITRLLERDHHAFEPDDIKVLTTAFEDALRLLGLADRTDPVTNIVASASLNWRGLANAIRVDCATTQ